jgi:hypothetical protein
MYSLSISHNIKPPIQITSACNAKPNLKRQPHAILIFFLGSRRISGPGGHRRDNKISGVQRVCGVIDYIRGAIDDLESHGYVFERS